MNALMYLGLPFSASAGATVTKVKDAPVTLFGYHILNNTAAIAYVQVFDKLSTNVTVGTTVPDYVIPVPANGGAVMAMGRTGSRHANGMSVACTTTRTGSVAAVCDVLFWTN